MTAEASKVFMAAWSGKIGKNDDKAINMSTEPRTLYPARYITALDTSGGVWKEQLNL